MEGQFLRSISSQRRGSLLAAGPTQTYKRSTKDSDLCQYGVENALRSIQLHYLVQSANNWDFNVFALNRVTSGRPLFNLGLILFQKHNLVKEFDLDIMRLMRFLSLTELAYNSETPYHNSIHATDVLQGLHCLLNEDKLTNFTSQEILASLIAAILHDVAHPGVNQNFLINTSSYLASIHGKISLLEHHHIQSAHGILSEAKLLDHLPDDQRRDILNLMDELILSTDFTQHKSYLSSFEERLNVGEIDMQNVEDRKLVLKMVIKCADISNQSRLWEICHEWSVRIMEEFFKQGDSERHLDLPISLLCDRTSVSIPKSQQGFIDFMAKPLFQLWHRLVNSPNSRHILDNLESNKSKWGEEK